MTTARLHWARGGEAEIRAISSDALSLRSTVPWPPGARIEGTLASDPQAVVRVKVHGCRKQPEGDYAIEGRAIDLAKPLRAAIEELLRG
jgi:hypothetical protein